MRQNLTHLLIGLQVTVENERRGTGGLVDFFVGDPGSRVLMNNVYRLRPACTAAEDSAVVGKQCSSSKVNAPY